MRTRTRSFILGGILASMVALGCQAPPSAGIKAPKVVERVGSMGVDPDASMSLRFESDCADKKGAYELHQVDKKPLDARISHFKIQITGANLIAPITLPVITREEFKDDCVHILEVLDLPPGQYDVLMNVIGEDGKVLGIDTAKVTVRNDGKVSELLLKCDFTMGKLQIKIDCCDPLPTPTPCPSPTPTPPCVCPTPTQTPTPLPTSSATPTPEPTPLPGTCAAFRPPAGIVMANAHDVAIDETGTVYVANNGSPGLFKFTGTGAYIENKNFSNLAFQSIEVHPDGTLWATSENADRLYHFAPNGATGPAPLGWFATGNFPRSVEIDPSGNVWVLNYGDDTVTKYSSTGIVLGTFPIISTPNTGPEALTFDAAGNAWISMGERIIQLSPTGVQLQSIDPTPDNTSRLLGIKIDAGGSIWVADYIRDKVIKVTLNATLSGHLYEAFNVGDGPWDVIFDKNGNVHVSNQQGGTVTQLSPTGQHQFTFVGCMTQPRGMALAEDGTIFVADDGAPSQLGRISPFVP